MSPVLLGLSLSHMQRVRETEVETWEGCVVSLGSLVRALGIWNVVHATCIPSRKAQWSFVFIFEVDGKCSPLSCAAVVCCFIQMLMLRGEDCAFLPLLFWVSILSISELEIPPWRRGSPPAVLAPS